MTLAMPKMRRSKVPLLEFRTLEGVLLDADEHPCPYGPQAMHTAR